MSWNIFISILRANFFSLNLFGIILGWIKQNRITTVLVGLLLFLYNRNVLKLEFEMKDEWNSCYFLKNCIQTWSIIYLSVTN